LSNGTSQRLCEVNNQQMHFTGRFGVVFAVLALHFLFVLAWWTMEIRLRPSAKSSPAIPMTVWLKAEFVVDSSVVRSGAVDDRERGHKKSQVTQVVADPTQSVVTRDLSGVPTLESIPTQPPLDLHLSQRDLKFKPAPSAAGMSPFRAPLPRTVETQIANVFSHSGPWVEERMDDDHIRMRRGDTCVTVERSLAEGLDAFGDYARRIPWRIGNPYKCQ